MAKRSNAGIKNDKERSKEKLIEAVGTVIRKYGYTGLTVSNISACADVKRRLINLYFGGLDTAISFFLILSLLSRKNEVFYHIYSISKLLVGSIVSIKNF
jgi:AcrR family transcriptional regulator